jgi:hypothetical protein
MPPEMIPGLSVFHPGLSDCALRAACVPRAQRTAAAPHCGLTVITRDVGDFEKARVPVFDSRQTEP